MSSAINVRKIALLLSGFLLLGLYLAPHAEAEELRMGDVASGLICQCGCNNVLSVCEMQGWAVPAKALIQERINQGWSKEEIISYFVEQYGPKILAAPPKEGFNITAWVMPFVLIGAGAALILLLLRTWVKRERFREGMEHQSLAEMNEEETSKYREKLKSELDSWKY